MNSTIWVSLDQKRRVTEGFSHYGRRPQAIVYHRSKTGGWTAGPKFLGTDAKREALTYAGAFPKPRARHAKVTP